MSRAMAPRVTSPAQHPEMAVKPILTPLVSRILARAKHGVLEVRSYVDLTEFSDTDAASLVAYLWRYQPTHLTSLNCYALRSAHDVAIIDACAALGTIDRAWCSVHHEDQMDGQAVALTRWLRNEKRPLQHAQLYWTRDYAHAPNATSAGRISDAAAADMFRASTNVRLEVKRGHISIAVSPRDRTTAQASASPAAPAAPQTFASRLACAALELSGGVNELSFDDACLDDDEDAAALLDRIERFGSTVQRLTFEWCGRPLIESPAFHALVRTLPNLRALHVYRMQNLQPEALRALAAAVSVSETLTGIILWEAGLTSESCGAWHDALTRAPELREVLIQHSSLTPADCALLMRGAAFSRKACWVAVHDALGASEDGTVAQRSAKARLASAARFTAFAGAEKLCVTRSPARRFLEGDGDRAIVWRLLRLLGIQP